MFVDIAGLKDTGSDVIELLNGFITKTIFAEAKTVKFMVTIPYASLNS